MTQVPKRIEKWNILKGKHISRIALLVLSILTLSIANPSFLHSVNADPTSGDAALAATVDVTTLPPAGNSSGSIEIPVGPVPFVATNASGSQSEASVTSSSSVVMVSGFEGLNQNQGGAYPPDVIAAAGPSHIVEMVNLAGEVWTKQGTLVRTFTLSSFFSTGSDFISDPKILYDAPSSRWFATILAVDNIYSITRGNVKIAVSTTNDPNGTWKIYTLDDGARLPDQPVIGINDDKFVTSVNDFGSIYGPFLGAHYWVLNKSQMVAGAATVSFASFGPNSSLGSVHPVQTLSSSTTMYMVSAWFSGSTIWLFSITGVPPGTVTVSTLTFAMTPIPPPPNAVQKGTTALVRTDDARVQSAAWFQGKLWFDLNDGCIPSGDTVQRSCVRLVQIDTATSTILQNFDFGANGQYYFYPALRVDSTGGLAVVYGFSSVNDYPSLAISGQAANDPRRSMAPPVTIRTGSSPNTSGRYGDYFGAGVDPTDPTMVWVAGEYQPSTIWATFIASMRVLSFTVTPTPSSISLTADATATSTVTLASLGGFTGTVSLTTTIPPGGLSASVSPATVTLAASGTATSTLTVSGSLAGAYTVTVLGISGSISHSANVSVTVTNFSLSVSPSSITIASGRSGSLTVQAGSINGYTGSIALSVPFGLPTCVTSGFTKPTLTLSAGGTDSSVLLLNVGSTCPASTGSVYIKGTDLSGVVRYAVFTLYISEFAVSVAPQPVGILRSACGDVTVTVFSLNGHSGLITLLGSGFPPEISASFLTNPVSLPSGGSATSTLHLCAVSTSTVGAYLTTVSGSDGVISRTTTFQILLNDYNFVASPNPTYLRQGATTSTTITASKYFGASASLSLTASGIPACVAFSFNAASLSLPDGGQSLLTMTASSTCTTGDYPITVYADGPGTSYDKQVTFTLRITAAGGGGGGGGSVAAGTLVTLADGTKVPVQKIKVGDTLMSYDPATNRILTSTVVDAYPVTVDNMVKIRLLDGTTIRTDNNPRQEFWVMKPDGTIGLMGVPSIETGDYLFQVSTRTWIQVVDKQLILGGSYTMFDIVTVGQYHYVVSGYLDAIKKIE